MQEFEPKKRTKILTKEFLAKYAYVFVLAILLIGGITYGYTFFVQNKKIASGSITTAALTINFTDLNINATGLSVPADDNEGMSEYSKSITISNTTTIDGKVELILNRTSGLDLDDMRYALIVNGAIQEIDDVPSDGKILSTAVMGNESVNVEIKLWPKTDYSGSETTFVGELTPEVKYLGKTAASYDNLTGKYVNFNCNGNSCEQWQIVKVEDGRVVLTRQADYSGATSRTNSNRYDSSLTFNDNSLITSVSTDGKNVYLAKTVKVSGGSGTLQDPYTFSNDLYNEEDKKITAVITYRHNGSTIGTQNVYYSQTNYISKTFNESGFRGWTDGTNNYDYLDSVSFTTDKILTSKGVVSIGDNVYFSLASAVDAVPTNDTKTTIYVNEDISENQFEIAENKNVELKLQNHVVTNLGTTALILNKGKLEINDYGELVGTDKLITSNPGQLTLSNGKYTGTISTNGLATITNVTINGTVSASSTTYALTIDNSTINTTKDTFSVVSSGILNIGANTVITSSASSGYGAVSAFPSSTVQLNGVTINSNGACVDNRGGNVTVSGSNLTSNIYAIGNDGTLTVGGNTSLTSNGQYYYLIVNFENSNLTLSTTSFSGTGANLISNSGTITVDSTADIDIDINAYLFTNSATGTIIINGAISNSESYIVSNSGTVRINNGADIEVTASGKTALINNSGGDIIVSGGSIESLSYAIWNKSGATATISGGSVLSTGTSTIYNDGTLGIAQGYNITYSGTSTYLYNSSTGDITMSGGNITVSAANVLSNYGIFTLNGGSITSTASSASVLVNQSGGSLTVGSGTINGVSNSIWNKSGGTAVVNGGTMSSSANSTISNSGTLTINNGNITNSGGYYAAYNNGGTATYVGGTCTPRNF